MDSMKLTSDRYDYVFRWLQYQFFASEFYISSYLEHF